MVFREIPVIRIGHLMLKFGGSDANGQSNFVPFKTIWPYLLGRSGWLIASANIIGNIALLIPFGFLAASVYRNMTFKKCLVLAVLVPVAIEGVQVVLKTGIFDIDDVILNGLGVVIGYFIFKAFAR